MSELEILLTNMQEATLEAIISKKQVNMIIDYINKLSKENKELKEQLENKIDLYEDTISYQLGFEKGKEYLKQEILEFINNLRGQDKDEFLGYGGDVILEILGDKE